MFICLKDVLLIVHSDVICCWCCGVCEVLVLACLASFSSFALALLALPRATLRLCIGDLALELVDRSLLPAYDRLPLLRLRRHPLRGVVLAQ